MSGMVVVDVDVDVSSSRRRSTVVPTGNNGLGLKEVPVHHVIAPALCGIVSILPPFLFARNTSKKLLVGMGLSRLGGGEACASASPCASVCVCVCVVCAVCTGCAFWN